jgi:hypothetical protein
MLYVLDTRFISGLGLLFTLYLLEVYKLSHKSAACRKLFGTVVSNLNGAFNSLALSIGLGYGLCNLHVVLVSSHSDSNILFSKASHRLCAVNGGADFTVPQKLGNLILKHCHSLVSAFT